MTDKDDEWNPLLSGLDGVSDGPRIIVAELRMMAAGAGYYTRFSYMSPRIRNVWSAAADIIEDLIRSQAH